MLKKKELLDWFSSYEVYKFDDGYSKLNLYFNNIEYNFPKDIALEMGFYRCDDGNSDYVALESFKNYGNAYNNISQTILRHNNDPKIDIQKMNKKEDKYKLEIFKDIKFLSEKNNSLLESLQKKSKSKPKENNYTVFIPDQISENFERQINDEKITKLSNCKSNKDCLCVFYNTTKNANRENFRPQVKNISTLNFYKMIY